MENLVTWPLHWSEAGGDLPLTQKNGGVGGILCRSTYPLTVQDNENEHVFFQWNYSIHCSMHLENPF